jgi:hypothetical protein
MLSPWLVLPDSNLQNSNSLPPSTGRIVTAL